MAEMEWKHTFNDPGASYYVTFLTSA